MTGKGVKISRRHKVQCVVCEKVFNLDYKKQHELKMHNGQYVKIKTVGAPLNPFETAKRVKKEEVVGAEFTNASNSSLETPEFITIEEIQVLEDQENVEMETEISACSSRSVEEILVSTIDEQQPPTYNSTENELEQPINNSISKISCTTILGQYAHLLDNMDTANKLLSDLKQVNMVNEHIATIQIMDMAQLINSACQKVINSCEKYFTAVNSQNANIIIDDKSSTSYIVHHDPGVRQPIENDNQREYLISLGPHQPRLAKFPADPKNRFNVNWYEQFEFLEYSTVKDSAFCFVCCLFPHGPGRQHSENAWVSVGVKNWGKMKNSGSQKLGKLDLHFSSGAHKAAVADYCNFMMKRGHIEVLLDKNKRNLIIESERIALYNSEVILILLDIARTLAKQGLAFRGNESGLNETGNFCQVVQLVSRHNKVLKQWLDDVNLRPYHVTYLSADSQNEFIELLGNEVRKSIIREINEAPFFTIMADTTPDSSRKDMLSLVIRTVNDNGTPKERLLSIFEAEDKTGIGLAEDIYKCLINREVNVENMAFQSYDFAKSMSGQFNGVQQNISNIVSRQIPYIPCQAHRTNTAVEHSCKASIIIAEMFNILEQLYVFFTASTKRFQPLKHKMETIENAISLRNLSKTRWTARSESIQAVSISFEAIIELLEELSISSADPITKTKALGLYKRMMNFDFIVSIFFMKNVMYKLKNVTEALESPNLNVVDAIRLIKSAVKSLELINTDENDLNNLIKGAESFAGKLGLNAEEDFKRHHRRRLVPKRLDDNPESASSFTFLQFFRKEFKMVLDSLINLLNLNVSACFEVLSPIFDVFKIPVSRQINIESLKAIIAMYPNNDKRPDVYALQAELEALFDDCSEALSMQDIMTTAVERRHILKLAFKLCQFVLTAGFSVATNERKFSQLKLIKSDHRTTITDERLESLMILKSERDLAEKIEMGHIVRSWSTLKKRRIRIT